VALLKRGDVFNAGGTGGGKASLVSLLESQRELQGKEPATYSYNQMGKKK